jgi:hypothetical protein
VASGAATILFAAQAEAQVLKRPVIPRIHQFRTVGMQRLAGTAHYADVKEGDFLLYLTPKGPGYVNKGEPFYIFRELADRAGMHIATSNVQSHPDEGDWSHNYVSSWGITHGQQAILPAGGVDLVVLLPHYTWENKWQQDRAPQAAADWYRLALYGNPQVRVFLWQHPLFTQGDFGKTFDPTVDYDQLAGQSRQWINSLADAMSARYGTPDPAQRPYVIPTADAHVEVMRWIKAGQLPGMTSPEDLWKQIGTVPTGWGLQGTKPTFVMAYLDALVRYAVIVKKCPIGLPCHLDVKRAAKHRTPTYMMNDQAAKIIDVDFVMKVELDAKVATLLQKAAWYAVVNQPYSGVSLPADQSAPAPPRNVKTTRGVDGIKVTWEEPAAAATGVYKYIIARSDGRQIESLLPEFCDRSVKPGEEFSYTVSAVDFQGMHSSGKRLWTTPVRPEIKSAVVLAPPVADPAALFHAPPKIKRLVAREAPDKVLVEFAESLDQKAAMNPANYAIRPGVRVTAVSEGGDDRTFILRTSDLVQGQNYELAVARGPANPFAFTITSWKLRVAPESFCRIDAGKTLFFETYTLPMLRSKRQLDALGLLAKPDDKELPYREAVRGPKNLKKLGAKFESQGNEFHCAYRDDLTGDFDFRVKLVWWGGSAVSKPDKPDFRFGVVAANDLQDLEKGGWAYVALTGDDHLEAGWVDGSRPDAIPDEINGTVQVPRPVRAEPPWPCGWLRLKRTDRTFSAFYANRALEEPVKDSDWKLIRQFETLGTGPTSHVGTFCSGEYPGWRGEAMAVFEVGPESWNN